MSWTLAITGKGGVGKTTLAALAVRWLAEHQRGPVLAVDADPNTSLDAALGVSVDTTVGGVREQARELAQNGSGGGGSKPELLDLKIQQALVEADAFDLIAMGRPEGPGCYCYANNVLRGVLSRLAGQYPSVVIDNEAGLENLSRRTVRRADWLLFVADPSARGLATAWRLYQLAVEMDIQAQNLGMIVNRARNGQALEHARAKFDQTPVMVLEAVPEDEEIAERNVNGVPMTKLEPGNAAYAAVGSLLSSMLDRASGR